MNNPQFGKKRQIAKDILQKYIYFLWVSGTRSQTKIFRVCVTDMCVQICIFNMWAWNMYVNLICISYSENENKSLLTCTHRGTLQNREA